MSANLSTPSHEMLDVLRHEFGPASPKVAEHLNSLGLRHYHGCGDVLSALQCHQEALSILDWNKCNALLFDRIEESKQYAMGMAITLSDIGNVLREMNDFLGAAAAYKQCLDLFIEGLVEDGGSLKRKLAEIEQGEDYKEHEDRVLEGIDREAIGVILSHHPGFRSAVRGISHLLREMQYVKFISQNAASSRRRRRMTQSAAVAANLTSAIASLNFSTSDLTSLTGLGQSLSNDEVRDEPPSTDVDQPFIVQIQRSRSWASTHSTVEEIRRKSYLARPNPIGRRAITSVEDYDRYSSLSLMIIPAEKALTSALSRFPGVTSILRHSTLFPSLSVDSSDEESSDLPAEENSKVLPEGKTPAHPVRQKRREDFLPSASKTLVPGKETLSPRSATQNISEHFNSDGFSYSISCGRGMLI